MPSRGEFLLNIDQNILSDSYIKKISSNNLTSDSYIKQTYDSNEGYSIIDEYDYSNYNYDYTIYSTYDKITQSFTGNGASISKLTFYIRRGGSPTGNLKAYIYSHSGTYGTDSTPDSLLATSDTTIDISTLTNSPISYDTVDFLFSGVNSVTLTNGSYYCVVLELSTHSTDSGNYVEYAFDNSSTFDGSSALWTGSTWSTSSDDFIFHTYSDKAFNSDSYILKETIKTLDSDYYVKTTYSNISPARNDFYDFSNSNAGWATHSGGFERLSQSFTASSTQELDSAVVQLRRGGSPTGNMYVKIYTHTGVYGTSSIPGSLLATSDAVDSSTVSTSNSLVKFSFSGAERITLTASTQYCVVFVYDTGGNSSNYIIGRSHLSGAHSGNMARYSSSSWTALSVHDMVFEVYSIPEDMQSDSWILKEVSKSLNSDSWILRPGEEGSLNSDTYIKTLSSEKTLDSDYFVKQTAEAGLSSASHIKKISSNNLSSDSTIFASGSETLNSTSYIKTTYSSTKTKTDSFEDGNYTSNPTWTVIRGSVSVSTSNPRTGTYSLIGGTTSESIKHVLSTPNDSNITWKAHFYPTNNTLGMPLYQIFDDTNNTYFRLYVSPQSETSLYIEFSRFNMTTLSGINRDLFPGYGGSNPAYPASGWADNWWELSFTRTSTGISAKVTNGTDEYSLGEIGFDAFDKVEEVSLSFRDTIYVDDVDYDAQTLDSDSFIKKVSSNNISSSLHIKSTKENNLTSDYVISPPTQDVNITSDSYILKTSSSNIVSNSYLLEIVEENLDSDSSVLTTYSDSLSSASFVKTLATENSLSSDSFILTSDDNSLVSDTYLLSTFTKNILSNYYVFKSGYEESLSQDSFVLQTYEQDIGSDSYVLKSDNTNSIESASWILSSSDVSLDSDSKIFKSYTVNLVSDSFIKRLSNENSLISDSYVVVSSDNSLLSDSEILTGIEKVLTVSPVCGSTSEGNVEFVWRIPIDSLGSDMGCVVEIDTVDTFDSGSSIIRKSYVDSGFEYWNGTGWISYPVGGVSSDYYHNNARVIVSLGAGVYYWRVRGEVLNDI